MQRRGILKSFGLLAGAMPLVAHAASNGKGSAAPGLSTALNTESLSEVVDECVRACEVCIAHCQSLLAKGDSMLGECLKKCLDVVPLCEATGTLSNLGSERTAAVAKVCLEACRACADSCKPHIGHHTTCKACYDACLKCIEACQRA
ncbi:MAG: four-helix bundle copper-binding protein [Silvanigrellales bacterium]|nr:four-helix bundle copper-binding protein [Silvanigrellales bacterium]